MDTPRSIPRPSREALFCQLISAELLLELWRLQRRWTSSWVIPSALLWGSVLVSPSDPSLFRLYSPPGCGFETNFLPSSWGRGGRCFKGGFQGIGANGDAGLF